MNSERWERIKSIFDSVVDLPADDRFGTLEVSCGADSELRLEIDRLLLEYDEGAGDGFLESSVIDPGRSFTAGDLVQGRYQIGRLLGRGGMGEVYEARDNLLNETIALKTLRPELACDRAMLDRFQKEIQAARKVTHPNVCRVFEVGVHSESVHYFTMELLTGETLAAKIKREGRIHSLEAIPLIRQMAEGLHAAHQAEVIHRDFKSANVMLAGDRAVITDFGLARAGRPAAASAASGAGGSDTAVSAAQMAGTLGYMSPEQLTGGPVSAASDIYSFGIVLFEMAAGKLPFDTTHLINSAVQRAGGRIPWIRQDAPDIDARWESAIQRCLQSEPEKRFQSAAEIANHFAGWQLPRLPALFSRRSFSRPLVGALALAALAAFALWPSRLYTPKPEARPWFEKGVEAVLATTYEAGRKALEKAVALDPGYPPAHAYLAAALSELDNQSGAKEEILKAIAAAQKTRLSHEDQTRAQALQHIIAREFDDALPLFSEIASRAQDDRSKAAAYVQLAWLEQKRQNLPATQSNLEAAVKLNSSHAGARLRLALVHGQKQDIDKATAAYAEAEALFRAGSDLDGVTEVLWQQARLLARANRTADSLKLAERGLAIAASTGSHFHEVRLRLSQALGLRNIGELNRSRELAEAAVKTAMEQKMEATASVGLLDLGNAYLLRSEPEPAERYFQQGLDAARRGHADFSEARAALSLASLYVQYNRPSEAMPRIEQALPFFRAGGYKRETMQGLLLLGGAQTRLAQYEVAERTLREAVQQGKDLRDREQQGLAHGYLSGVLDRTGRWPEAIAESTRALELFGDLKGGYRAAHLLSSRARIWVQLGNFDGARADIAEAAKWAGRATGNQAQVKARLALAEAELAYLHGRWNEAAAGAKKAAVLQAGGQEDRQAALLTALCATRSGSAAAAATAVHAAIKASEDAGDFYEAALGRLWLAEAIRDTGAANAALQFFEPRQNWEAVWRCRRAMGGGVEHRPAQNTALAELRRTWPAETLGAYLARPDFKKFGNL